MPGAKFWMVLAVFQVLFGIAVFAATRAYYLRNDALPAGHPPVTLRDAGDAAGVLSAGDIARSLDRSGLASTDPMTLSRLADDYFAAGQYQDAADAYERLLAMRPADATLLNNLGLTLHYLGRSGEALERLRQGIAADPGNQRIWLTTGFVNGQLGNVAAARDALEQAAQIGTDESISQSAREMLETLPD